MIIKLLESKNKYNFRASISHEKNYAIASGNIRINSINFFQSIFFALVFLLNFSKIELNR